MDILISYDVNTTSPAGRRRLRRVAQTCENYGQRVQLSVFECTLTEMQRDALLAELAKIIDKSLDSIRCYRMTGGRDRAATIIGRDSYIDFTAPLMV